MIEDLANQHSRDLWFLADEQQYFTLRHTNHSSGVLAVFPGINQVMGELLCYTSQKSQISEVWVLDFLIDGRRNVEESKQPLLQCF